MWIRKDNGFIVDVSDCEGFGTVKCDGEFVVKARKRELDCYNSPVYLGISESPDKKRADEVLACVWKAIRNGTLFLDLGEK